jgi:hypothetical protein
MEPSELVGRDDDDEEAMAIVVTPCASGEEA